MLLNPAWCVSHCQARILSELTKSPLTVYSCAAAQIQRLCWISEERVLNMQCEFTVSSFTLLNLTVFAERNRHSSGLPSSLIPGILSHFRPLSLAARPQQRQLSVVVYCRLCRPRLRGCLLWPLYGVWRAHLNARVPNQAASRAGADPEPHHPRQQQQKQQ